MKTHLALIRGINVGKKQIKMEDLRKRLEDAGFVNVSSYIQSGNILLGSDLKPDKIAGMIEKLIRESYGFEAKVVMLDLSLVRKAVAGNPFTEVDQKQLYIAFLDKIRASHELQEFDQNAFPPDQAIVKGRFVYVNYETSAGTSKLTNAWLEKQLKVTSTMRNWNTANKLLGLLSER